MSPTSHRTCWTRQDAVVAALLDHLRYEANPTASALAAAEKRILAGGEDRRAHLLDYATGRELISFGGHSLAIRGVTLSPDGKHAATTCIDRIVRIFRIP